MIQDVAAPNMWSFLSLVVSVVVAPAVMWHLNRKQTATITKNAVATAAEVKSELEVAKSEIKLDTQAAHEKLDRMEQTAEYTKEMVNGDRTAKEARIKALERQLRKSGIEPHP